MNTFSLRLPALMAAALSLAFAQATAPAGQPGVTIRATTTLVQVSVVAHDAQGQAVADLTKGDFELLDKGKPQPIAVFIAEKSTTSLPAPPVLPANNFTNRIAPAVSARGGYSVILLDFANTGFRNTARARLKAIEVANRLGPTERVGLYIMDRNGIRVDVEPGVDRPALLAKLGKAMGIPSPCFQRQLDGLDDSFQDSMDNCGGPTPLALEVKSDLVDRRIRETLRSFEAVADHLAGLPGRKGLIWITSAFPLQLDLRAPANQIFPEAMGGQQLYDSEVGRAMRRLSNADVALYPVDSRALSTGSSVSADDFTWPTMDFFAERTGGVAFHGRNDLDMGMQAAIEDVQVSYTLGFYAAQDRSAEGFHKLSVRPLRPGVKLRYKEGYYVEAPPKSASDRKEAVARALTAIMDETAIPLDVQAARDRTTVKLRIALRPDTLALAQKGDRWQGRIEVIARFAGEDGKEVSTPTSRKVEFNLTQRSYDAALHNGVVFSRTLAAPAKAARLRLLVRNDPSGEIGTLTIPLERVASN